MTEQPKDGGAAVPLRADNMALRDAIAMHAPPAPITLFHHMQSEPRRDIYPLPVGTSYAETIVLQTAADIAWVKWKAKIHAEWAYIYADEFLAAREATQ